MKVKQRHKEIESKLKYKGEEKLNQPKWYTSIWGGVSLARKRVSANGSIGKLAPFALLGGIGLVVAAEGNAEAAGGPAPVQIAQQFQIGSVGKNGNIYGSSDLDDPTKPDQVNYSQDVAVLAPGFAYFQGPISTDNDDRSALLVDSGLLSGLLTVGGATEKVTKCTTINGLNISNCIPLNTPANFLAMEGLALHPNGNSVLTGGIQQSVDVNERVYQVESDGTITLLSSCGAANYATTPSTVVNGKFHFIDNSSGQSRAYQTDFDAATDTCIGPKVPLGNVVGYDSSLSNTPVSALAIDPKTGTVYFTKFSDSSAWKADKTPACNDGFIESGEDCDGPNLDNKQCTDLVGGFTGGTLACNAVTCTFDTSACTQVQNPVCSDNIKNGDETCDGNDFGGATCETMLGANYTGTLTCDGCTIINTENCVLVPFCGDGLKNGAEACEGNDLGGKTCADFLFDGGTLACDINCQIDQSQCTHSSSSSSSSGSSGVGGSGGAGGGSGVGGGMDGGTKDCPTVKSMTLEKCVVEDCTDPKKVTVKNMGHNSMVAPCDLAITPEGAIIAAQVKISGQAGQIIALNIGDQMIHSVVEVPKDQEVSVNDVMKNEIDSKVGGTYCVAEGTGYSAECIAPDIFRFTCTEKLIKILADSTKTPLNFQIDGYKLGQIPAGWSVEVNVVTLEVTKAPYQINPPLDGGAGGSGGSTSSTTNTTGTGGTSTTNTTGTGGTAGQGGAGGSTITTGPGPDPEKDGCDCSVPGHSHNDGNDNGNAALAGLSLAAAIAARRRKQSSANA